MYKIHVTNRTLFSLSNYFVSNRTGESSLDFLIYMHIDIIYYNIIKYIFT